MTILLDMDGVLADFTSEALVRLNEAKNDQLSFPLSIDGYVNTFGKFDMAECYGITQDKFWRIIEENNNFWINLKPFPWASMLVDSLRKISDDIIISTSPSLNPICAQQKLEWLFFQLGITSDRVMIGSRKELMSCKDVVLIDDYHKNIDKFNKGQGKGILVPSNWNTKDLSFEKVWGAIIKQL